MIEPSPVLGVQKEKRFKYVTPGENLVENDHDDEDINNNSIFSGIGKERGGWLIRSTKSKSALGS